MARAQHWRWRQRGGGIDSGSAVVAVRRQRQQLGRSATLAAAAARWEAGWQRGGSGGNAALAAAVWRWGRRWQWRQYGRQRGSGRGGEGCASHVLKIFFYFSIRSVTTNNHQPQRRLDKSDLSFIRGGLNNKIQQLYSTSIKQNYQLISPTIALPIVVLYLPTIT